ncbi:vacuolar protein sorting-associated protein 53 [Plasmodium gonderi]|uniref:Vacuolar protein sorting-associated protein 53 n=1 Tax=Plasmodium gonderi TaxID=77519 RepID=A0A1Y1JGE6_PLAGO|nr:vacuolar protein sorting-associated protein 53 [Plasmodium gonderi]GAW79154.1 vacuolar protein sorting-associated protein 53 [Plasmodium gonderi]
MFGDDEFVKEYINGNISKIEDVEIHVEKMNKEIMELDKIISEKIENQVLREVEYEDKLKSIKEKMKLINNKMEQVDKKTEESEHILVRLCKDIKKLDIGKKNVTETIIIMKRIVMVITAISNLKKKALKRDYSSCIPLVSLIKEMLIHISDLKTNSKLSALYKDASVIFDDLKHQIKEDIDLIYDPDVHIEKNLIVVNEMSCSEISHHEVKHDPMYRGQMNSNPDNHNPEDHNPMSSNPMSSNPMNRDKSDQLCINLFDACKCLYELDHEFVSDVAKKFTNFFLEKYIVIFENQGNNLEGIDRRMAWLKRSLNSYENNYASIFPPVYNIPYHIVSKFCSITKKHVVKIMSSSVEEINPVSLIQTVIKVINFENFLTKNVTYYAEKCTISSYSYSSMEFPFPELIMQKDLTSTLGEILPEENFPHNGHVKDDEFSSSITNEVQGGTQYKDHYKISLDDRNDKIKSSNMNQSYLRNVFNITSTEQGSSIIPLDKDSTELGNNKNQMKSFKHTDEAHKEAQKEEKRYLEEEYSSIISQSEGKKKEKRQNFKGVISCVFDSYLCSWLKYEEKKIVVKFENIINDENKEDSIISSGRKNETKVPNMIAKETFADVNNILKKNEEHAPEIYFEITEEKHSVYKSAYKLFYIYKSYVNMILLFSNCQTLYDFVIFFKTLLLKYSEELNKRIVKNVKEENKIKHFKLLSIIINTSSYVEQTLNEAQENIVKDIDSIYKEKISFKEEEKLFLQIKTKCIKGIITFMENKINTIISNNNIVNIFDINNIQEKSFYIINMESFIREYFSFFKKIFNETYFTYLLEKTSTLIIQQFYHTILSFQFMTNITAQQLLIDSHEIEQILLHIPTLLNQKKGETHEEWRRTAKKEDQQIFTPELNALHKTESGLATTASAEADADTDADTEEERYVIPQTYFSYVKNQMKKIKFLIKIFISNIYDMNSFNLLLTENNNICTIQEIEKILSLKDDCNEEKSPNDSILNKNYVNDIKERGIKAAEEVKFFFNKITNM